MTFTLILIFSATCVGMIAAGLWRRGGIYGLPFLAACVMLGFMLPQFVGLVDERFLPPHALDKTLIMAILSALMFWLGWRLPTKPLRTFDWDFDERRLALAALALVLGGLYFGIMISRLPDELVEMSQWSGPAVALLFFAGMGNYGFAIAALLYMRSGSRLALLTSLIGALPYLSAIVLGGRRTVAAELFCVVFVGLWFCKRRALPRGLMVALAAAAALFVNSIGEYRQASQGGGGAVVENVLSVDYLGNVQAVAEEGGFELLNAAYLIAATDSSFRFDYGAFQWNLMVFRYVPAQIVGRDLKEALLIPVQAVSFEEFMYAPVTGTTFTGLADAFRSFWYFGALLFLAMAALMAKLYLAAMRGVFACQLFYVLLLSPSLVAITHYTTVFPAAFPHMALFLLPALLFARKRGRSAVSAGMAVARPGAAASRLH